MDVDLGEPIVATRLDIPGLAPEDDMSSTVIRPAATPARTSSVSLKTVGREPSEWLLLYRMADV